MRLNKYLAAYTHLSRRKADEVIANGWVTINGVRAELGTPVSEDDLVALNGQTVVPTAKPRLYMLHKPEGYICSHNGQGAKTIYHLLPPDLFRLNTVGRLDKDSSGLLLLTNDGTLLNELTHPSHNHKKTYIVTIDLPLDHQSEILLTKGINIGDNRPSKLALRLLDTNRTMWQVTISEGRNRQIRRSFAAVERRVLSLHRTVFGNYQLGDVEPGEFTEIVV
jgi:23S rRNA pseudouridine2605 synthase